MRVYVINKADKELPYNIEIHDYGNIIYGGGTTPSGAIMAALSIGRKIPTGLRNRKEVVKYILDTYSIDKDWIYIIHVLEDDKFLIKEKKE